LAARIVLDSSGVITPQYFTGMYFVAEEMNVCTNGLFLNILVERKGEWLLEVLTLRVMKMNK
jgi:hypothetical protein